MPCHAAILDKITTAKADQPVEDVLKLLKKSKRPYIAILDDDGALQGMFSYRVLYKNLMPISVNMNDGVQMDLVISAAPGIAKRLKKVKPLPVSEFMNRRPQKVYADTSLWEAVNMIVQYGAPIFVVENENNKLVGVINEASAYLELDRMQKEGA